MEKNDFILRAHKEGIESLDKLVIQSPENIEDRVLLISNPDKGPEPLQKGVISDKGMYTYNIEKVLGCNCPNKFLITINNQIVCFVNNKKATKEILDYAYTRDPKVLENGKIRKRIDTILG